MHSDCDGCPLHLTCSRMVFADGNPESKVVFVGEGPGSDEDAEGIPFVGRSGKLLTKLMTEIGLTRDDCYVTNVVKCFPNADGRVRAPTAPEIEACSKRWTGPELRALSPLRLLVPVGGIAASFALGQEMRISEVRGKVLPGPYCERTLPVYHPSYLLRAQGSDRDRLMKQARDDFRVIKAAVEATAKKYLTRVDVAEKIAETKVSQLREEDRATIEQHVVKAPPWRPDRRYIAGWSDDRDVCLLYRNDDGERRMERITGVPWYFFMRADDAVRVPVDVWRRWEKLGIFERLEPDPVNPDWCRIYAVRKVTQTQWLKDRGEVGVGINILDDVRMAEAYARMRKSGSGFIGGASGSLGSQRDQRDRKKASEIVTEIKIKQEKELRAALEEEYRRAEAGLPPPRMGRKAAGNYAKFAPELKLHDFLLQLHETGPTYEADLTPKQRFMTDNLLQVDDRYAELYFDIETDDSVPGWEHKETWRHLAYSAVFKTRDGELEKHSLVLEAETDEAEAAMLRKFRELVDRADVLYAWNGFNFDFPILRARFRKYGIWYDWRQVIWCDLLAVWRRYHYRGASAVTSFALSELAPAMLNKPKLDWRTAAADRGTPARSIIELYRVNRDLLREYCDMDAQLLYELEQEYGYAAVERAFCRVGNCFVNDYHVSTKVDMLLLNRGAVQGRHFFTRGLQLEALPAYIKEIQSQSTRRLGADGEVEAEGRKGQHSEYAGAYVFPPVVGYHEGVAALDFKSLYPTVMTLFNISPEAWVSRDEVDRYGPDELTRTPSGAHFRKRPDGIIPLVFRETLEKRKVYQRLQLGEEVGSHRFLLYYRLAYAFKRLGLSFYGELGNETSRYFNPEVAEAVTLSGQWFIKKTAEFAERKGYRVLAGDTDSIYLKMTEAQAQAFVKECDGFYREAVRPFNVDMDRFMMELEYENYFRNILFVRKKRYAGLMAIFKGKESKPEYLEVKGLELMRSDGVAYSRALQKRVLDFVLRGDLPPVAKVERMVTQARAEVFSGSLKVDDVAATQAIEKSVDEYKTKPPHVRVAEHIREVSTEYFVGMKVPYVMVPGKPDPAKPNRRPALEAVWTREYVEGSYHPAHAWEKKIYPATMRVLQAAYQSVDWERFLAPPSGYEDPWSGPRAAAARATARASRVRSPALATSVRRKRAAP